MAVKRDIEVAQSSDEYGPIPISPATPHLMQSPFIKQHQAVMNIDFEAAPCFGEVRLRRKSCRRIEPLSNWAVRVTVPTGRINHAALGLEVLSRVFRAKSLFSLSALEKVRSTTRAHPETPQNDID